MSADITIFHGDSLFIKVDVLDLDGNPVDVSNVGNIIFAISNTKNEAPQITYEYTTGDIILGGGEKFSLTLPPADSSTLTPKDNDYYYEARIVDGSTVQTVLSGKFIVKESTIEEI